jgi:hypothetical protein
MVHSLMVDQDSERNFLVSVVFFVQRKCDAQVPITYLPIAENIRKQSRLEFGNSISVMLRSKLGIVTGNKIDFLFIYKPLSLLQFFEIHS